MSVLQVEGPFEIGGDLTVEAGMENKATGSVSFSGTPTLRVTGDLLNVGGSWISNGADVVIQEAAGASVSNSVPSYGTLTLKNTTGAGSISLASDLAVAGAFALVVPNSVQLTVSGTVDLTAGSIGQTIGSGGAFAKLYLSTGRIRCSGNCNLSFTDLSSGEVILDGAGLQLLTVGGNQLSALTLGGGPASTYQLQDALTVLGLTNLNDGEFDVNDVAATFGDDLLIGQGSVGETITLRMGSGLVTLQGDFDLTNVDAFSNDGGTLRFAQASGTQIIVPSGFAFAAVEMTGGAAYALGGNAQCTTFLLQSGTLSESAYVITASGNVAFAGGAVAPAAGEIKMVGNGTTLDDSGGINAGNIRVSHP